MNSPAGATYPTTTRKYPMKKILVLATLAALSFGAQASCAITMVRDDAVARAFDKHGGWDFNAAKYELLCEKLRKNRARVSVQAMASVLSERSVGWAVLSVQDMDSALATTSFGSLNTIVNTYASEDKADQLMVDAINNAARDWEHIDKALASLDAERKRARARR